MDQDIHYQHQTAFASGASTTYHPILFPCTLRNITAIVQADPGDAETITVTYGATAATANTAMGVATFGSDIAAGALATWAADATTGGTVMAAGGFLKFVTSAASAADVLIDIELDPYAR